MYVKECFIRVRSIYQSDNSFGILYRYIYSYSEPAVLELQVYV